MMKRIIGFVIAVWALMPAKAQEPNQLNEMIYESVCDFLEHEADFEHRHNINQTTYLCLDNLPKGCLSNEQIKNLKAEYPNVKPFIYLYEYKFKKKKKYHYVEMNVLLNGNVICIDFKIFELTRTGKRAYSFAISDGAKYNYEYSCGSRKWKKQKPIFWGI